MTATMSIIVMISSEGGGGGREMEARGRNREDGGGITEEGWGSGMEGGQFACVCKRDHEIGWGRQLIGWWDPACTVEIFLSSGFRLGTERWDSRWVCRRITDLACLDDRSVGGIMPPQCTALLSC